MRRIIPVLFILLSCMPFVRAEEELLDRVVAVVNDEVITQAELDAFLRPLYEEYKQQYSGEELMKLLQDARSKLLGQMIEDKLVYQEALAKEIEVKEDDIEKELETFKARLEKREDIDAMLEREGMSMKSFREKLKKQIMVRKLQDQEVRAKVLVSPLEIEQFYKDNPDKFKSTDRVKVRSLTVKKSPEAREKGILDEKAKDRIDTFYLKIKQGGNFDELVAKFSEDSHAKEEKPAEWIERGSMIESVDIAIFETPAGQLTGIVETPIGYHIFRIEEKENARVHTFEETRDQIANYLYQVKTNERFKEWLQGLRKTAYISIR